MPVRSASLRLHREVRAAPPAGPFDRSKRHPAYPANNVRTVKPAGQCARMSMRERRPTTARTRPRPPSGMVNRGSVWPKSRSAVTARPCRAGVPSTMARSATGVTSVLAGRRANTTARTSPKPGWRVSVVGAHWRRGGHVVLKKHDGTFEGRHVRPALEEVQVRQAAADDRAFGLARVHRPGPAIGTGGGIGRARPRDAPLRGEGKGAFGHDAARELAKGVRVSVRTAEAGEARAVVRHQASRRPEGGVQGGDVRVAAHDLRVPRQMAPVHFA